VIRQGYFDSMYIMGRGRGVGMNGERVGLNGMDTPIHTAGCFLTPIYSPIEHCKHFSIYVFPKKV